MLDQATIANLQAAINNYYTVFNVDRSSAYGYECINHYYSTGRRTIGFHPSDGRDETQQEIALLWTEPYPNLPQYSARTHQLNTLLQKQYAGLPSVLSNGIIWPTQYSLDDATKDIVGKMLSVCYLRRMHALKQTEEPIDMLIDLVDHHLLEISWINHRFPNAIYIGVGLGEVVPGTILQQVTQLYIVSDPQRASVLH